MDKLWTAVDRRDFLQNKGHIKSRSQGGERTLMLSFEDKRAILRSFPELKEVPISNDRYNYELQNLTLRRRIVAREFSSTGNGYVWGAPESPYPPDVRGWINVKNFDQTELRQAVRYAINALRTADLRQRSNMLLQDSGLLPLTSSVWRRFEILHEPPIHTGDIAYIRHSIEREVGEANGIYVYVREDGTVLYIGKAKPLKNRLWSHYLESFQTVKGDTKDNRWHRFFSSYQGRLIVHWLELEDEDIRQLVEHMLTIQLAPAFMTFK
ncbi:MAG: hypothetical protein K6T81_13945 [Alicyclobacillus macrosporangiidus]|uniref:hypothetical protein n=1 Tax=Alicyclobacillus macrosporangiidus TaxID=392015 RepID=UPI0026EC81F9|nr:hypothetical protein [Alicyclobacillus macrosporangiidus]MCL6599818.1 hypothetical protein [Alicyclobacillus macrosporangiidus]